MDNLIQIGFSRDLSQEDKDKFRLLGLVILEDVFGNSFIFVERTKLFLAYHLANCESEIYISIPLENEVLF